MKERRELKATIVTVAGSILVFGIQRAIEGMLIEAGLAIAFSAAGFWAYEHVQQIERYEVISDMVEELNDEQVKQIIEQGADVVETVVSDYNDYSDEN